MFLGAKHGVVEEILIKTTSLLWLKSFAVAKSRCALGRSVRKEMESEGSNNEIGIQLMISDDTGTGCAELATHGVTGCKFVIRAVAGSWRFEGLKGSP